MDKAPPPLPAKPAGSPISPSPTPTRSQPEKSNGRSDRNPAVGHLGGRNNFASAARDHRPEGRRGKIKISEDRKKAAALVDAALHKRFLATANTWTATGGSGVTSHFNSHERAQTTISAILILSVSGERRASALNRGLSAIITQAKVIYTTDHIENCNDFF